MPAALGVEIMMSLVLGGILPALVFMGFVGLSLRVRPGDGPSSKGVRALMVYVVVSSLTAGVLGLDLWPFAAWRFAVYPIDDTGYYQQIVGVDGTGREHAIDTRAFQPLEAPELDGWMQIHLESLPHEQRLALLRFLLERAQAGLARAHAGRPIGTFGRILGPFAAPLFQGEAEPWADRTRVPAELVDLRVYRGRWRISGTAAHIETRVLVADARP